MMGTIVIDERIYPIRSFALGEGAILAVVSMSVADAVEIPRRFDWSLHAPDGSFVCRGRLDFGQLSGLRDRDAVELTFRLDVEGKIANSVKASA